MSFTVMPAIDLHQGRVVRLYQGDFSRQTCYDITPLELVMRYAAAGAKWLHVVDLEGARQGQAAHVDVIEQLARTGLRIQAGGGVRCRADVQRLREAGVERVVVGSVAVQKPEQVCDWLQHFGVEHLTLALDTRKQGGHWTLPTDGWEKNRSARLQQRASRFTEVGACHLLCTDIDRDGTLSGPNLELLSFLRKLAPSLRVQVSGGVRQTGDIRAARQAGASAIILGRALLEGRFTMAKALTC